MEDKEYNVVTLENGVEYTEIHRLTVDGKEYVVLANLDDDDDFCFRRLIKDGNEYSIVMLDSDDEFDKVSEAFKKEFFD